MLKTLFEKTFGSASSANEASAHNSPAAFQLARIRTLIEFFPIGKKLRYYPEFKQDIVFDTLILAYCVNGHYVYSSDSIDRDAEGFGIGRGIEQLHAQYGEKDRPQQDGAAQDPVDHRSSP